MRHAAAVLGVLAMAPVTAWAEQPSWDEVRAGIQADRTFARLAELYDFPSWGRPPEPERKPPVAAPADLALLARAIPFPMTESDRGRGHGMEIVYLGFDLRPEAPLARARLIYYEGALTCRVSLLGTLRSSKFGPAQYVRYRGEDGADRFGDVTFRRAGVPASESRRVLFCQDNVMVKLECRDREGARCPDLAGLAESLEKALREDGEPKPEDSTRAGSSD